MNKSILLKIWVAIGMLSILLSYIISSYWYEAGVNIFFTTTFLSVCFVVFVILPLGWLFLVSKSHTYVIRKGMNYSGFRFKPFYNLPKATWEITLHDGCKVETEGIQKIFGVGDINHHENSMRVGFRYIKSKDLFNIYLYGYKNGTPFENYLFSEQVNKKFKWTHDGWKGLGKYLFFYFEQDGSEGEGAPQEMRATVTKIS